MNQIIVAMDMEIEDGIELIETIEEIPEVYEKVYGYKIGSLWIVEEGKNILKTIKDITMDDSSNMNRKVILDMQKWGTDIPEIVEKQVNKVGKLVDELICCPMGAGDESLRAFVIACRQNKVEPICVLDMTHPNSDKYLIAGSADLILKDAYDWGIRKFVVPATKTEKVRYAFAFNRDIIKEKIEKYATGFKTQGGQVKPMVDFGVTKFIVGRAIYEAENPIEEIDKIYKEINEVL